jgi:hypothetical protein
MDEVAAWLRGLGLAKYVKDFEDNEIDFDALPHLTERHRQVGREQAW